jgi:hypothetical protein
MTAAEKKAMNIEIEKQLAEYDKKNAMEIDALVLWVLHSEYGFGEKRLRQFFERFQPAIQELVDHYQMDTSDDVWLCTQKLKDAGIDIEEWYRQMPIT